MHRASLAALTALVLSLLGATQAGAAVQPSVTPFSVAVTNPCTGGTGTLSGTETASTLVTATGNLFHYESTARIDETFTPDNPAEPSAGGHGSTHVSFVASGEPVDGTNVYSEVRTDVFHAPGETVVTRYIVHTTVVDGKLIVSFDRPMLVCQGT